MAIENDGTEFHGERLQRFGGIAVTLEMMVSLKGSSP